MKKTTKTSEARPIPDLVIQAGKGYTIDYAEGQNSGPERRNPFAASRTQPPLEKVRNLVKSDSTAISGIHTLVDRSIENGWFIRGKDGRSKHKKAMQRLKELDFDKVSWQVLFHRIMYNNAFIELVRDGTDEIVELNVLEPTLMRIKANVHGEVEEYWQEVIGAKTQDLPRWKPEEIIHLKASHFTTAAWGDIDLESLERAILIKREIKRFVHWLFATNQFRGFFAFKEGASDEQIKQFLAYYRSAQGNIEKPITLRGELMYQVLRDFSDSKGYLDWIYKMDEEILNLLQVPPIWAGLPDNSNRSNSDAQIIALNTRVKSIQKIQGSDLTKQLLPKLSFEKVEFGYWPVDKKSEKDIIDVAERLVNMGVKDQIVQQYMTEQGFDIGDGNIFRPREPLGMKKNITGSMDQYESRKGKAEGEANQKIGTGSEGTTREDQLVTQAKDSQRYWTYDHILEE